MRTGSPAGHSAEGVTDVTGAGGTERRGADAGRAEVGDTDRGGADVGTEVAGADVDETAAPFEGSAPSTDEEAQAVASAKAHPTRQPPHPRTPQCWPTLG